MACADGADRGGDADVASVRGLKRNCLWIRILGSLTIEKMNESPANAMRISMVVH